MGASSNQIRAGGAFVEVTADTDKAKKNLTGLGGTLDMLKKGLGEDSKFGGLFKILAGAGAVAGLAVAGRLLSDMTAKAVELADAYKSGQKNAGEMTDELWQSLPILGDLRKAGLNIRELWSDEAREIRKTTADAERMNAAVESRRALLVESTKQLKEQRAVLADMAAEMSLIGKRGIEAQVGAAQHRAAVRERQLSDSAASDINALEEKAGKSPEAAKDLKRDVAARVALFEAQKSTNVQALSREIDELYRLERKRLREGSEGRQQNLRDMEAETAAIKAQTAAENALTEAEAAHLSRVQEISDIEKERADSIRKAQQDARADIEAMSSDDVQSAQQRMDDLQKELGLIEALAAAREDASARRASLAQLGSVFNPIEEGFESATGGGIMRWLDDFFGPLEDAYDGLKSRIWDQGGSTFGTFNGGLAEQGGGVAVQKLTDIAKYSRLQYEFAKSQVGGPTFR